MPRQVLPPPRTGPAHAAVLAVALVVLCTAWQPQAEAALPAPAGNPSPFGLHAGIANRFFTDAERERATQMLAQAGAAWTREEFCWSCMERSPQLSLHSYQWQVDDWFDYDRALRLAGEQHLDILGLLDYGPGADVRDGRVYRRQSCPADANAAPLDAWLPAWREFVRAVVSRYHDQIRYWEIQNEPTSLCFWRKVDLPAKQPSAADYVKVLRAASEVIRAIDPQARVVLAGLSPEIDTSGVDYFEFLAQVQAAGGWPDFDIVAIHPYRTPFAPEAVLPRSRFDVDALRMQDSNRPYDFQGEVAAFHQLMEHWGQKPIWLTEIGWSVESLKARARQRGTQAEIVQADYLIRSSVQALAAGAQMVMWYDFRDDAVPSAEESSFGLVHHDFSPKPAYYAFGTLAHLLAGSQFDQQVRGRGAPGQAPQDDVYEYRFVRGRQTVVVLWRSQDGDGPQTVTVDGIGADTARLIGPELDPWTADAGQTLTPANHALSLALGERPVFLLFETGDAVEVTGDAPGAGGAGRQPSAALAEERAAAAGQWSAALCALGAVPWLLAGCVIAARTRRRV